MSTRDTWIGYPPAPPSQEDEDRTARAIFGAREEAEDRTELTRSGERPGPLTYLGDETDYTVLTADMVEQLRAKLREAAEREEREASGVRQRPTPEPPRAELDSFEAAIDPLADLDIEVEPPQTLDELEEVLSPLPELEIALAPNSESNFYAGFDDEHPDGVFLATYERLPVGTPVYATVLLPAGYHFRTPAIVEWARENEASQPGLPAGLSLRMCGLDARIRMLIRSYVKHRRPIFYVA